MWFTVSTIWPTSCRGATRAPRAQGVVEGYAQTAQRWPAQPLARRAHGLSELTGPRPSSRLKTTGADLAGHGAKRALGQLIDLRVSIVDEDGAPVPGAMVEIWHCNAAGKYIHPNDSNDAPEDPNFYGARAPPGRRRRARRAAHHQAGRLSGARHRRLVAPAAHPFLGLGPRVALAPRDADVLPRRAAQRARPDPERRARPAARAAAASRASCRRPATRSLYEYDLVVRGRNAAAELP